MVLKSDIINLSNEREENKMEEKRNYVVYASLNYEETERVVLMTAEQAKTIQWFMDTWDIDGTVALAEDYVGEEI